MKYLLLPVLSAAVLMACGDPAPPPTPLPLPPAGAEARYPYPGDVWETAEDPFGACAYGYDECGDGYGAIDCGDNPCVYGTCTESNYEGHFCACQPGYAGRHCAVCADDYAVTDCPDCEAGFACRPEATP